MLSFGLRRVPTATYTTVVGTLLAAVACSGPHTTGAAPAAAQALGPSSPSAPALFPTMETTGPRVSPADLQPSDPIVSSFDGQVIERLDVRTRIKVVHDDVTVRDVRITFDVKHTGAYALQVSSSRDGTCPTGVLVEHIEIIGETDGLPDNAKAVYGSCPFTLRNSRILDVGSGIRITSGARIERNFIHANHSVPGSGSHRSGVGLNGGSDNVILGNSIECEGEGCSAALALYGDFAQVENVLVQDNLFNTTGSYCTYAGSLKSKAFPQASGVQYVGNVFGRKHHDGCGRYGPVAGNDSTATGHVWRDNVWQDTGLELP